MKRPTPEEIVAKLLNVGCCADHGSKPWPPMWSHAFLRARKCPRCRKLIEMELAKLLNS